MRDDKRQERPESYPKPTETDVMLKQQDEFNEDLNSQSSSHFPHPDDEPPQVKKIPGGEDNSMDRSRDLP